MKTVTKFKSQNADGMNEFFWIGKRTVAIAGNGDEYTGTVVGLDPSLELVEIDFDDGSHGEWSCGATSKYRP